MHETPEDAGDRPRRRYLPRVQPLAILDVPDAQLTLETVRQLTGLGKSTIYRMMRAGDFPENFRVGKRGVRWHAADMKAWLQRRPHQ